MKNKTNILIFIVLQVIVILSNLLRFTNIEITLKILLTIFIFIYFLIIKKEKNKRINIYLIISFLLSIFYGFYIELDLIEVIKFIPDYIYCPITLMYILDNYKKINSIKERTQNILVIISNILSLFIIINSLLKNEISLFFPIIAIILYPLALSSFEKENSIINVLLLLVPTIAIVLSSYNVLIFILLIILLMYLIFNIKKKNNIIESITLLAIPILYLIVFNDKLVEVTFSAQKSMVYILLEIVIFYIPFLYVFGRTIPKIKKNKGKTFDLLLIFVSLILTFIIGIYTSTIFSSPLFIISYSLVLAIYLNKLVLSEKKLNNKITIFALHLGYGGIEQYLSSLCMMLESNFEIEIISTYKLMDKPAFKFSKGVKITYLIDDKPNKEVLKKAIKEKKIFNVFKEGFKSLRLLYQKKYLNIEKIENTTSRYIITTRDFHNDLVGKYARNDIIKIATEHNYHNDNKKYINKVINSVKKVNYFILVSEVLREFYDDKVNAKCIFIPNVIDSLPKDVSKCNKHNIISIGRLSKEKGQTDLIDVVALLKEKYKDIKLYLVGDGEEKNRIENYIRQHKLSKNVVLTGFLSKNDIELKMLDSSVFVTTSYTESFGLVVIEACSYKLPVVAFDSATGVKKLLEKGNGILVSNRDKEQMSKEISRLFEDNKYREKVANQGYNGCKKYLAKNVKKQWLELIK